MASRPIATPPGQEARSAQVVEVIQFGSCPFGFLAICGEGRWGPEVITVIASFTMVGKVLSLT